LFLVLSISYCLAFATKHSICNRFNFRSISQSNTSLKVEIDALANTQTTILDLQTKRANGIADDAKFVECIRTLEKHEEATNAKLTEVSGRDVCSCHSVCVCACVIYVTPYSYSLCNPLYYSLFRLAPSLSSRKLT
jgi:hypothetical protein